MAELGERRRPELKIVFQQTSEFTVLCEIQLCCHMCLPLSITIDYAFKPHMSTSANGLNMIFMHISKNRVIKHKEVNTAAYPNNQNPISLASPSITK